MGSGCRVTFEFVDRIPRAPSGKARVTLRLTPDEVAARPSHDTPAIGREQGARQ